MPQCNSRCALREKTLCARKVVRIAEGGGMRAVRRHARLWRFAQSNGWLVRVCVANGTRREKRFAASRVGRESGRLRGECANVNLRCRVRQIGRTAVRRFAEGLRGTWGNAEEPCSCAVRHAGHIGSSCAGGKCEFQSGRAAAASRARWRARGRSAFCIVNFSLKNKAEFEKRLRISAHFGEGGIVAGSHRGCRRFALRGCLSAF